MVDWGIVGFAIIGVSFILSLAHLMVPMVAGWLQNKS